MRRNYLEITWRTRRVWTEEYSCSQVSARVHVLEASVGSAHAPKNYRPSASTKASSYSCLNTRARPRTRELDVASRGPTL